MRGTAGRGFTEAGTTTNENNHEKGNDRRGTEHRHRVLPVAGSHGDAHPQGLPEVAAAREGPGDDGEADRAIVKVMMPPEKFGGATQKFRGSAGKSGRTRFPSGASA